MVERNKDDPQAPAQSRPKSSQGDTKRDSARSGWNEPDNQSVLELVDQAGLDHSDQAQ